MRKRQRAKTLTFEARRRKVCVSCGYGGPLLVEQNGDLLGVVPLWRLRGTGETDDPDAVPPPMTFRFHAGSGAGSEAGTGTRLDEVGGGLLTTSERIRGDGNGGLKPYAGEEPPSPREAAQQDLPVRPDALNVESLPPPSGGAESPMQFCYIHEVTREAPADALSTPGVHALDTIREDAGDDDGGALYDWFIEQTLGTNLPVAVGEVVDNRRVLQEFGEQLSLQAVRVGAEVKHYLVFRGSARLRSLLRISRYRAVTPTATAIAGGSRSALSSAGSGVRALGRGGTAVTLVFVGAVDFAQWPLVYL